MGERDDRAEKRKKRTHALQKIVAGLTDPNATSALERAKSVAKQLEYENVAGLLDTGDELMDAVLVALNRGGRRYTADEAAERAGISPGSSDR